MFRKSDINCATRGKTCATNYDATPGFLPFFCGIYAVFTVGETLYCSLTIYHSNQSRPLEENIWKYRNQVFN